MPKQSPTDKNTEEEAWGAEQSLEILRDRTRAWWIAVLAGQAEVAHPIHGTSIKAVVSEGTLTISGTLPSEQDRREVVAEAEALKQQGVERVVDELTILDEGTGDEGLLVQMLIGVFENKEQAAFAEGYLEGHAHITPDAMKVVAPEGDFGEAALAAIVPSAWVEDAQTALQAGRSLLIVTVDETQAFRTRELLDEETRSLRTLVLPPEPTGSAGEQQKRLEQLPPSSQTAAAETATNDGDAKHTRQAAPRRKAAANEA